MEPKNPASTSDFAFTHRRALETAAVLRELFELLEDYAPAWYTEEHHRRASAVLDRSLVRIPPKNKRTQTPDRRSAMTTHFSTVPLAAAPKERANTTAEHFPPLVLIVDDEPLIAETLAAILQGVGMAAITAPDAQAALEVARVIPPQMLITDVAMPRFNGFDLAVEVNRIAPDCKIILFSGQPSTYDLMTEFNARGYDFVTLIKPVHPTDLLACVFEQLGKPDAPISRKVLECTDSREEILVGSAPVRDKPRAHRVRKPRAAVADRNGTAAAKLLIN